MLETGMSIIAVNLPSLWVLRTSDVPRKALRTLQGYLSNKEGFFVSPSKTPSGVERKRGQTWTGRGNRSNNVSQPCLPPIAHVSQDLGLDEFCIGPEPRTHQKHQVHATGGIMSEERLSKPVPGVIHVQRTMEFACDRQCSCAIAHGVCKH